MKRIINLSCIIIFTFLVNNTAFGAVFMNLLHNDYVVLTRQADDEGGGSGTNAAVVRYDFFVNTIKLLRGQTDVLQNTVDSLKKQIEQLKAEDTKTKSSVVHLTNHLQSVMNTEYKKRISGDEASYNMIEDLEKKILESIKNIPAELKPSENIQEIIRGMIKNELSTMKEEIKGEILKELKQ